MTKQQARSNSELEIAWQQSHRYPAGKLTCLMLKDNVLEYFSSIGGAMNSRSELILRKFAQAAAWGLIFAMTVLSVVPPTMRPVVIASHDLEHTVAFLLTGVAVGLGYPYRWIRNVLALLAFAAAIEIAQLWVPGRHARLTDLVINAVAASVGVGLALFAARLVKNTTRGS